ncbi:MAG: glycosyltransferase family 4 protein [Proteobacteria bacterium]|nr:glycosyltransferase family 4 protein [Pseudomonadota bacterium]
MPEHRQALHIIVPGKLDQPTGGYRYALNVVERIRASGRVVHVHELPGSFPVPDVESRQGATALLGTLGRQAPIVIDGLALPAFDGLDGAFLGRALGLIHHPLSLETGIDRRVRRSLAGMEERLFGALGGFIVTSEATAHGLKRLTRPAAAVTVVEPGLGRVAMRPPRRGSARLLTVATITPRKGHLLAVAALAGLKRYRWRLDCVGATDRDPTHARRVLAAIRNRGLGRRIRLHGAVSEAALERHYCRGGVFLLPSFHEGYGMALAEALAHGLPVLGTRAGAIPDTVPARAGRLVRIGDVRALRRVLAQLLRSARLRRGLREAAIATVHERADWTRTAKRFVAAVDQIVAALEVEPQQEPHDRPDKGVALTARRRRSQTTSRAKE